MYDSFILARYRLNLVAGPNGLEFPVFKGSVFRGNFGNVFRKIVCLYRENDCSECLLKHRCAYAYIFDTSPPPGSGALSRYRSIPRPFLIEPPSTIRTNFNPREIFSLDLVLIGKAIDFLPYFAIVFGEMGESGIGRNRRKFKLDKIIAVGLENEKEIYNSEENVLRTFDMSYTWSSILNGNRIKNPDDNRINIHFETPTCLKDRGNYTRKPEFHVLFRQVMRRISALSFFHQGFSLQADYSGLADRSRNVKIVRDTTLWQEWERFSNHQQRRIPMGGVVGTVSYEGGDINEFLPWLRLGEHVHVGKNTVSGLGKYSM